jgi:hypothetical protein
LDFLSLDLVADFRDLSPQTSEERRRVRGAREIGVGVAPGMATAAQGKTDQARFG